MSTRATYSFESEQAGRTVYFYVHHDNYPEGAAEYLYKMHKLLHSHLTSGNNYHFRGGLAEAFLKANLNAEFTRHHSAHADTEFAYSMAKDGTLSVRSLDINGELLKPFFRGHYAEFINKYNDSDFKLYKISESVVGINVGHQYLTLEEITKHTEELSNRVHLNNCKQYSNDYDIWLDLYRSISNSVCHAY